MNKFLTCLALIITFSFIAQPTYATDIKGINLGLQKTWWNVDPPNASNLNALMQENRQRIALAAADGFNLIRVTFRYSLIDASAPLDRKNAVLSLLSDFVTQSSAKGLDVIVSLTGDHDGSPSKADLVCREEGALLEADMAIAGVLPDSPNIGMEPLNEPPNGCGGEKSWENVQHQLYMQLRQAHPHMMIILYGGDWGSLDGLLKLDPSPYRNDPHVLYSFHYYEPFLFTTQGSSNNKPQYKYVNNLTWPYDPANVQEVGSQATSQIASDSSLDASMRNSLISDLNDYQQTGSPSYASQRFNRVMEWAQENHVSPNQVFVGEFGVLRTQKTSGTPRIGAPGWMMSVKNAAQQNGFLWAAWDLDGTFAVDCGKGSSEKLCDDYQNVFR